MRGMLTPELEELADKLLGIDLTTTKLRLIPYVQYLAINSSRLDRDRVNDEELDILVDWEAMGFIQIGKGHVKVSKQFWDAASEILWLGYANT